MWSPDALTNGGKSHGLPAASTTKSHGNRTRRGLGYFAVDPSINPGGMHLSRGHQGGSGPAAGDENASANSDITDSSCSCCTSSWYIAQRHHAQ
jgi:hypothetical protein